MRHWRSRLVLSLVAAVTLLSLAAAVYAASVVLEADIPYAGTENPRQRLDLLLPAERGDEPLPVVVYIHGGAWLAGDKTKGVRMVTPLVATGKYAGVAVGYRLTGEVKWPAQIHDCKAAIRWIRAHAEQYGLDGERIGVWGESAGGHLSAMLGTSGDVPAMDGQLGPYNDLSSRVACAVDDFGPTDFMKMDHGRPANAGPDFDPADWPESRLLGVVFYEHPELVATANPITYVSADDAPFLIVHGTADPIVPFNQSEILHAALAKVGVPSTLITVEGGGHGMGFPPEANQLVRRFFADHLLGEGTEWHDETIQAAGPRP